LMRALRSSSSRCGSSRAAAITSSAVSPGAKSACCGTYPTRVLRRMEIDPESASICPLRMRSRVDLPDPFGPIRPNLSPSEMPSEIPVKRRREPKDFEIEVQLSSRLLKKSEARYLLKQKSVLLFQKPCEDQTLNKARCSATYRRRSVYRRSIRFGLSGRWSMKC